MNALDLFAGPGGWDVGARELGIEPVGIELDDAACKTREAAGLPTLQANVAALDPLEVARQMSSGPEPPAPPPFEHRPGTEEHFEEQVDLLIASPPCQAWSMAGKREGQKDIERVYDLTRRIAGLSEGAVDPHAPDGTGADEPKARALAESDWADLRSQLVTEPLRWALALRPRFIAWEQVPPVLDYWRFCAGILRDQGYSVWTGILSAERYGVPQTRKRAILMASLDGDVEPPSPTHQAYVAGEPAWEGPMRAMWGAEIKPWVSVCDAMGWEGTLRGHQNTSTTGERYERDCSDPAPTVTARTRAHGFKRREGKSDASDAPAQAVNAIGGRRSGLKPKDLVGIPWRVAFALQADGWWLRSDIVWAKPNPMPESVTDRPSRSHEYVFLLAKSQRYFYDADAIRENATWPGQNRADRGPRESPMPGAPAHNGLRSEGKQAEVHNHTVKGGDRWDGFNESGRGKDGLGRNKRSVWEITTRPYKDAHFATFPPKLVEPCILAGSPPKACGECGAPWRRVVERAPGIERDRDVDEGLPGSMPPHGKHQLSGPRFAAHKRANPDKFLGWQPTCGHQDDSARAVVLDPFAGAGTTGLVVTQHGRDFIGLELNPEYAQMARDRIARWEANPAGYLEASDQREHDERGQLGLLGEAA